MADAEVVIGADASAVERAAAVAKAAWRDAGQSITSAIGSAAQSIVNNFAQVVTAQGHINFGSQLEQVRAFERATAQLALASGRSLDSVRREAEQTGVEIGKRPQEVAAWTAEVGRLTGNFDGAEKSMRSFSGLAVLTGRSVDDYKGLASTLSLVGVTGDRASQSVGILVSQSKALGNSGGVNAFTDQIEALSDVLTRFSGTGATSIERMTALVGVLGKGLNPAAAKRVQGQLLNEVTGDTFGWSRYLGHEITDEHGQVSDPTAVLREIQQKFRRTYGRNAGRMAQIQFGAEGGAALMNADFSQVDKLAALKPSADVAAAQKQMNETDAGKRDVAQAELAKSANQLLNSSSLLGQAADALQQFAAHNPITSTFLTGVFSASLGNFMSQFGSSIAKMMGGGNGGAVGGMVDLATKGTSLGGVAGTALKAIPVVGSFVAGAAAGAELGKEIDDYKTEHYDKPREAEEDAKRKDRMVRMKEIRDRVRAARGLGTLPGGYAPAEEDNQLALATRSGSRESLEALVSKLTKEGESKETAEQIATAVADALSRTVIQVHNAADTPVTAVARTSNSRASGDQSQD